MQPYKVGKFMVKHVSLGSDLRNGQKNIKEKALNRRINGRPRTLGVQIGTLSVLGQPRGSSQWMSKPYV